MALMRAILISWRRIANVNETIEIRSLCPGASKHFMLAMASRWAAFSGNTSSIQPIATFSSFDGFI